MYSDNKNLNNNNYSLLDVVNLIKCFQYNLTARKNIVFI